MNNKNILGLTLALLSIGFYMLTLGACAEDRTGLLDGFVTFQAQDLLPLKDRVYKLWLYNKDIKEYTFVSDLAPDINGTVIATEYMDVDMTKRIEATGFVVSIELDLDLNTPQGTNIIAGEFAGRSASAVAISDDLAIGDSLQTSSAEFLLISPSTLIEEDSLSGIWFHDTSRFDTALLFLPELNDQWTFEAWVQFSDTTLSIGRFRTGNQADSSNIYSGLVSTIAYPGEDFINNLPPSVTTPVNLIGTTVFITVEPSDDFDRYQPFYIRLLSEIIQPESASSETTTPLFSAGSPFPQGNGSR